MEALRSFASGFKMPDFSKLWQPSDDAVDGAEAIQQQPLCIRLEPVLVRLQELALWTDPKSSLIAIALVQVSYLYLVYTESSVLYLTAWAGLASFVYTTWVNRIWPEIRVQRIDDDDSVGFTPLHPDCLTGPELQDRLNSMQNVVKQKLCSLIEMRQTKPGVFCCIMTSVFLMTAYLGTYMSFLSLIYYMVMALFVGPGLHKHLKSYPAYDEAVQSLKEKMSLLQVEQDTVDAPVKTKDEVEVTSEPIENAAPSSYLQTLSSGLSQQVLSRLIPQTTDDSEDEMKEYLPDNQSEEQLLDQAAKPEERPDNDAEAETNPASFEPALETMPGHEEEDEDENQLEIKSELPAEEDEFIPTAEPKAEDELDEDDDSLALPRPKLEPSAPIITQSERLYPQVPDFDASSEEDDDVKPTPAHTSIDEGAATRDHLSFGLPTTQVSPDMSLPVMSRDQLLSSALSETCGPRESSPHLSSGSSDNDDDFELISEEELKTASQDQI